MTEKEWRMFNDILLEIYYAGSLETFGERCLKLIRILIPYTQGYFLVIDEDGRLDVAHSVFENVDPVMKRKYLDTYFAKDYLMQMCNFTKSMAYRDTDLLTDEKRRASVIYREYFKPQKLDMGCGLIIMKEGKTRVFFNLLLQIMEDGRLTDGQGRTVDFKNAVIIMTSNAGARALLDSKPLASSRCRKNIRW